MHQAVQAKMFPFHFSHSKRPKKIHSKSFVLSYLNACIEGNLTDAFGRHEGIFLYEESLCVRRQRQDGDLVDVSYTHTHTHYLPFLPGVLTTSDSVRHTV